MIGLLSFYWKPLSILALSFVITTYIGYLRHEASSEKAKNIQLQLLNTQLEDDVHHWQDTVIDQNKKIDDLNAAFNLMTRRVDNANAYIQKINVESASKLDALKKYYESIPDSDSCEAVKNILNADVPNVH